MTEPETWIGNVAKAAQAVQCKTCGSYGYCYMPSSCPKPEKPPGRTGHAYCNRCGAPHSPGECLRGER